MCETVALDRLLWASRTVIPNPNVSTGVEPHSKFTEGSCGQIGAGLLTDSRRVGVVQVVALRNRERPPWTFP